MNLPGEPEKSIDHVYIYIYIHIHMYAATSHEMGPRGRTKIICANARFCYKGLMRKKSCFAAAQTTCSMFLSHTSGPGFGEPQRPTVYPHSGQDAATSYYHGPPRFVLPIVSEIDPTCDFDTWKQIYKD